VMIGGGTVGDGIGRVAERVIKTPTKRAPAVLRTILDDFNSNSPETESFHQYYDEKGKDYFYQLLKPLADLTTLKDDEYVDWGHEETFATAIGVGECAGVVIDLVATLLLEGEEKLQWAGEAFEGRAWSDAIYHSYSVFVNTAKALLLDKGVNSSTQIGILREFNTNYIETGEVVLPAGSADFNELVLQINKHEPTEEFAIGYLNQATEFYKQMKAKRGAQFTA
jgi:sulfite reductase (ferredoxin)